jgi:23S rRNA pseudouridine1911/1915/1917 synthase
MAAVNVIYEDNHLLVAEKPYGVPSQEDETGDDDMLSLCKAYIKEKYQKLGNVYLGLVHRLDRPTGGVMVFARTSKAAARLTAQIQSGAFEKTYLAVLTAAPREQAGTLIHWLLKDEAAHIARIADEKTPGAKRAELEYETLARQEGLSLVRIRLKTGRFHQIRAQMAAVGCAVYGDMKYGARNIKAPLALFAYRVCLDHPTTGQRLCFTAKPVRYPFTLFDIPDKQ